VYGVGDHGGGPTRRDLRRCHEMDAWPIYPRFKLATTRAYYQALEAQADKLPELAGELNFEFTGCYTTQTRIKRTNRLAEHLLCFAEAAASLAWRVTGRDYPAAALRRAWIDALFGHFHDILPGSGVRETREYHMGRFQDLAATATAAATHSLRSLAGAIDTSALAGEGADAGPSDGFGAGAGRGTGWGDISPAWHAASGPRVFVAFNPTSWPRSETLEVTAWDAGDGAVGEQAFVARFADGRVVPAQRLAKAAAGYWGHQFVPLAVPVTVGGLGHTAFVIAPAGRHAPEPAWNYGPVLVGAINEIDHQPAVSVPAPLTMENKHLRVRLDSLTGGIVELLDKVSGLDLADPARPAGLPEYVLERPGGMTAWVIHEARQRLFPLEVHAVERLAAGPHVAAFVVRSRVKDSSLAVKYSLKAGARQVEMDIEADWLERGSPEVGTPKLRLLVPLALTGAKGRYEIPFGSIQRDLNGGQEVPALRWADVTGRAAGGKHAGCALLNDSKYGHSLDGDTLALTLIRSSYDPDPLPEIGHHSVRVALMPHAGAVPVAELIRAGEGLNQPVRVVPSDLHAGELAPVAAGVEHVRPGGVVLSAVKKAEDYDALIFRLYETAGRAADAAVALSPAVFGKVAEAVEVDLLERPVAKSAARVRPGGFGVKLPAFGIASVKVAFAT
ncbi:MAG TPA: glycoside hydrolase family 38 C-terminal domain-containing protein, partial [Phycisphaerae bacterium]|nr:glycoside hydrolase family 38 C-terminal domain-containing protein [Phycisphaerae bacterium]